MKFRYHRGTLEESMETVVELPATLEALGAYLKVDPEKLTVTPYPSCDCNFDRRTDWHVHIVTLAHAHPLGYTDEPVSSL